MYFLLVFVIYCAFIANQILPFQHVHILKILEPKLSHANTLNNYRYNLYKKQINHRVFSYLMMTDVLNFLEADPHFDISNIPMHLHKQKEPLIGKVVSVHSLLRPQGVGDVCNIIINHSGKLPFYEGQSCGVTPPGLNLRTGKLYTNRLYSMASTRYGENMTVSSTLLFILQHYIQWFISNTTILLLLYCRAKL